MTHSGTQTRLVARFTTAGILFGWLFPLGAWALDLTHHGYPWTLESLGYMHQTDPMHWIIDMAPLVLGMVFYLVGVREARILELNRDLTRKVEERTAHLQRVTQQLRDREAQLRRANEGLAQDIDGHLRSMKHQALHDPLTGLANRSLLARRVQTALNGRIGVEAVGVLHIDLDGFRLVNDSLGHEAGDQLLKVAAERLLEGVAEDGTVAHIGGDEFAVVVARDVTEEAACDLAERLLARLARPMSLAGHDYFPSASIGVAIGKAPAHDQARLLRHADAAMHAAKEAGGSGYAIYETAMSRRALERVDMAAALRFALANNELRVHYQPLVNLSTGAMCGAEALVRWDRAGHGIVSPGEFVPLAEETGQIVPIGWWVLRAACAQAKEWYDTSPERGLVMNVNLSGRQLQRPDVVDQVAAALRETGLPPNLLKLEITESVLMADGEAVVATLRSLKDLGVKLALDDFGTGYSSMASLHAYPIDTVKIDRAFISRLQEDDEATALVAAIMLMAQSMGIDVTAEGIENATQVAQLQELRCDVGQGYFFARPMPASEVAEMMEHRRSTFARYHRPIETDDIEQLLDEIIERREAA